MLHILDDGGDVWYCWTSFDVSREVLEDLFAERATYNVRLSLTVVSRTTVKGTITTEGLLEAAGQVVDCRSRHCDE